jgi:hypothetical protein
MPEILFKREGTNRGMSQQQNVVKDGNEKLRRGEERENKK